MKKNSIFIAFLGLFLLFSASLRAGSLALLSSVDAPFTVTIQVTKYPDMTSTQQTLYFTAADADVTGSLAKTFTMPTLGMGSTYYKVTTMTFVFGTGASAQTRTFQFNTVGSTLPGVGGMAGQAVANIGSLQCELQLMQPTDGNYQFLVNCH